MDHFHVIPARRTPLRRAVRLIMGLVAVTAIVWGLASLPYDVMRQERARLFGEEATTGQVLSVRTNVSPDYPGASLIILYRYLDPDGFAREAEARMEDSSWTSYRPGAVIRVLYATGRPEVVRTPGEVEPPFQVWLRNLMH